MSTLRSGTTSEGYQNSLLRQIRKENVGAVPGGYRSLSGRALEVVGDDQAPWFKAPPFTDDPVEWWNEAFTADAGGVPQYSLVGPVLTVADRRSVTCYFTFTSADATGQLSVVPVALALIDGVFQTFPLATVDAAITYATRPFFGTEQFATRFMDSGELHTQVVPNGDVARFTATWDVTPYTYFSLYVADLSTGTKGSLIVLYSTSL